GQFNNGCTFTEVRGSAFDGIDRTTQKFEDAFGVTAEITNNYDATAATMGLLSGTTNAVGGSTTYSYDDAERVTERLYGDPSRTPTEDYAYDFYGHIASITSSTFGSESYTYDKDGRLTQKSDPTGGSYASPGVINYGYYPDGKRASLSLTINPEPQFDGTAFNGTNVLQYAYQTDGELTHEQVGIGTSKWNYKWTYTAADREHTQSDPDTGDPIKVYAVKNCNPPNCSYTTTNLVAKTYTYDQYGQIATLTFPSTQQMPNFAYDAEGEVIDDFGPQQNNFGPLPPAPQYLYSIRGELVWTPQPPGPGFGSTWATPTVARTTANGALCAINYTCSFDTRSSQTSSQLTPGGNSNTAPNYPLYTYDNAGRNTATSINCYYNNNPQDSGTLAKVYDTENHLISTTVAVEDATVANNGVGNPAACFPLSTPGTFAWGNSGHPYVVTTPEYPSGQYSTSYHWDGDQLLYSVSGQPGTPSVVLYLGMLGEVPLSGSGSATQDVFTNDRDYAGQQYQYHNSTVYSQFSPPGARMEFTTAKFGTIQLFPPSWGGNDAVRYANTIQTVSARKDGYQMDGVTIQGVRAYDPTGSQWSSPDVSAGNVGDPVSQKPFIWNGNDSLSYEDPTGYDIDWANSYAGAQKDWNDTVDYLKSIGDYEGAGQMIFLESSPDFMLTVENLNAGTSDDDGFTQGIDPRVMNVGNGTIDFNPRLALAGYDKTGKAVEPPTLSLFHEAGHAFDWVTDPANFKATPTDDNWQNTEDRDNILYKENPALKLAGLPERTDHISGYMCAVNSITSTTCGH
ncbi:MAG: hypothetical protein ABIZ82_04920, partial [Candidatus Tumulicola sp.]